MEHQKIFHARRRLKILAAVFIGALAVGFYWQNVPVNDTDPLETVSRTAAAGASILAKPVTGGRLPAVTFYGPRGQKVSPEDFKGKFLLLNFWATWCGPCVMELPSLDQLRETYADQGLEVVAVSIDQNADRDVLKTFLKSRGISDFALYHDTQGDVQSKIALPGIPVTYLLSPEGQIAYLFEGGANWMDTETRDFFRRILEKS